jgi:hypothetical protein
VTTNEVPGLESRPMFLSGEHRTTIDAVLERVLELCWEACQEFENSEPESNEWSKHKGEILAYGRITAMLMELEAAERKLMAGESPSQSRRARLS